MFTLQNLHDTLFFDIETVPAFRSYYSLPEELRKMFDKKFMPKMDDSNEAAKTINNPALMEELYQSNAALYPEFGKIICIAACNVPHNATGQFSYISKHYIGEESEIITNFFKAVDKFFTNKNDNAFLCGHNIKDFDIPFLLFRALANKIHYDVKLPSIFNFFGKKPWEIKGIIDTMDMFKFSGSKGKSLNAITNMLGIPSPKTEMDGSKVSEYYYDKKDIESIARYCINDVEATAKVAIEFTKIKF